MSTRFCIRCGEQIPENSKFCINCGAPVNTEPTPEPSYAQQQPSRDMPLRPKNYLALAILTTIFCCLPFGIVSIVYAAKVDNYWNSGDYVNAEDASRKARGWILASIITAVVAAIAYSILIVAMGLGAEFFDELY